MGKGVWSWWNWGSMDMQRMCRANVGKRLWAGAHRVKGKGKASRLHLDGTESLEGAM